jgi:hypothetical protein
MENKIESPDYQLMDISEAGTTTADNISTSSASPTISNQAENEIGEKINGLLETVSKNMNSMQLSSSMGSRNNLTLDTKSNVHHHQTQKLTPVHHHPLEILENEIDEESEDSCNNKNVSNFPDVVLSHSFGRDRERETAAVKAKADLVNIHNNNDVKSRKPIYREPSPVSKRKL